MAEHAVERASHSQAMAVAAVTIANGGDNLGIYIPLFATQMRLVPVYAAVFAVMTGVWCAAGYALVRNLWIGKRVSRMGHVALPYVLMALGVYILSGIRVLF
jgi:cadmium resistance protein CadD (predicted permease)